MIFFSSNTNWKEFLRQFFSIYPTSYWVFPFQIKCFTTKPKMFDWFVWKFKGCEKRFSYLPTFFSFFPYFTQKCSAQADVIAKSQISANFSQYEALDQKRAAAHGGHLAGEDDLIAEPEMAPTFLTQPRSLHNLREGQRAHFEAKLEPITDPHLQVEWLKDGKPIIVGHRFRPIHDFGYVALVILDVINEDSGVYTARATNLVGSCECSAELSCQSKGKCDFTWNACSI